MDQHSVDTRIICSYCSGEDILYLFWGCHCRHKIGTDNVGLYWSAPSDEQLQFVVPACPVNLDWSFPEYSLGLLGIGMATTASADKANPDWRIRIHIEACLLSYGIFPFPIGKQKLFSSDYSWSVNKDYAFLFLNGCFYLSHVLNQNSALNQIQSKERQKI